MDGLGYFDYLRLSRYERWAMHEDHNEWVVEWNSAMEDGADGPPPRPKDTRR